MLRSSWIVVSALAVVAGCSTGNTTTDTGATDTGTPTDTAARVDVAPDVLVVDVNTIPDVPIVDVGTDAGSGSDAGSDAAPDAVAMIGPHGGTVDRLRFAVFGDVRPPYPDQNGAYPSRIFGDVMGSVEDVGVQFAVATGDYMNANLCTSCVNTQLDLLAVGERRFHGQVFHALGNHECATVTSYNCSNEDETTNIRTFRSRLLSDYAHTYFDWVVRTSNGDAHFISTAPNAWNSGQAAWLTTALARPATYTFVIAHEPPSATGPGTLAIEDAMALRTGGISMRFYGHVHEYSRVGFNGTITGNAGAALSGTNYYGFVVVEQRADGNLVINSYEAGHPAMIRDSFVVQPNGMPGR